MGAMWEQALLTGCMSEQAVVTRLTGHDLWLQSSHSLRFPAEAMNMNESVPEVLHGKR